jgi:predicted Rossmann fold nucleotide-binding protein DprA/Smf involved in DNA uptake
VLRRLTSNPDPVILAGLGSTYWYEVDQLATETGLKASIVRSRLTRMGESGQARRQPGPRGKVIYRGVRP